MISESKETHIRSIIKAITYRIFGTLLSMITVFIVSGSIKLALEFGILEIILKIIGYYIFERIWSHIPIGYGRGKIDIIEKIKRWFKND